MNIVGFSIAPAQLTASAATYLTASNCKIRLDKVTGTNTTAVDYVATIYKIVSGGSASATNTITYQKTILAGQTVEFYELEGHWLEPDSFIQALADVAAKISFMISGIKTPK